MTTTAHASSWASATAHAFADGLDDQLTISGADGHHLGRVRRLRVGEVITVADGAGQWRAYATRAVIGDDIALEAESPPFVEARFAPRLTVAPALIARNRFDDMVIALVELGVDTIIPFAAKRSVVEWRGAKRDAAIERLYRLAREASMQCRRSWLPTIAAVASARDLAARPGLILAVADGVPQLRFDAPPPADCTVVTGPEGGFAPEELQLFEAAPGMRRVQLGPHVLRAETAPLAAVAVVHHARSHLGSLGE